MKNFWRKVDWTTNKIWLLALSVIMVITILGVGVAAVGDPVVQGGTYTSGHLPVIDTDNVSLIDGPGYDSTTRVIEAATGRGATYVVASASYSGTAQYDEKLTAGAEGAGINAAFSNLTAGRTNQETLKIVGSVNLETAILIPSYTRLDLTEAKLFLNDNVNKPVLVNDGYAGVGNTEIDIVGGYIDGNKANNSHDSPPGMAGVGYTSAIYLQNISHFSVDGVYIYHSTSAGIDLYAANHGDILNNTVELPYYDGISLKWEPGLEYNYYISIKNNTVITGESNNNFPIEVQDGSYYVTISENKIYSPDDSYRAISLWSHDGRPAVHDITISNNIIYIHNTTLASFDGISVVGLSTSYAYNVSVVGNVINLPVDGMRGVGIRIEYAHGISVTGNAININNTTDNSTGVYINSSYSVSITANTIYNSSYVKFNGMGIHLNNSSELSITGNVIENIGYRAISFRNSVSKVTISHNTIKTFYVGFYTDALESPSFSDINIVDNVLTNPQDGAEYVSGNFYNYAAGFILANNRPYIAPGETRTATVPLAAALNGAIGASWHNPELQVCYIKRVVVSVNFAAAAAATGKVGIADDAAGTNLGSEFFTAITLDSAGVYDSYVAGDTGAQTKYVWIEDSASATDGWINLMVETNDSTATGTMYIEYVGK